jgi:hypothetical protein
MVLTPRFITKSAAAKAATSTGAPARAAAAPAPRTQPRVLHSARVPAQLSFCFTRV